jgi:hypothetical protein
MAPLMRARRQSDTAPPKIILLRAESLMKRGWRAALRMAKSQL